MTVRIERKNYDWQRFDNVKGMSFCLLSNKRTILRVWYDNNSDNKVLLEEGDIVVAFEK